MATKVPKNYLKYWRVIEYWAKTKYEIAQADLDLMLFLHSEKYFGHKDLEEYGAIMGFERKRLERLIKEGWIDRFRTHYKNQRAIFKLSYKASRMVDAIYAVLSGEEIPMDPKVNPLFKAKVRPCERKYREAIIRMNDYVRANRVKVKEANAAAKEASENEDDVAL